MALDARQNFVSAQYIENMCSILIYLLEDIILNSITFLNFKTLSLRIIQNPHFGFDIKTVKFG